MCLLALAYRLHPRYPLVLAGNRDEFHHRPALALAEWSDGSGIVGGRDLQAGGGWLALHQSGRLAAVTNVREGSAPPPGQRSRGELIPAFLASPATALAAAEALAPTAAGFGPFNLLLFDGQNLAFASNRPNAQAQPLAPGLYGLSNAGLDTPWPKTLRLKAALAQWLDLGDDNTEALFAALADETPVPEASLPATGVPRPVEKLLATAFIRSEGYGTRASSVVLIGAHQMRFEERSFGPNGSALAGHSLQLLR